VSCFYSYAECGYAECRCAECYFTFVILSDLSYLNDVFFCFYEKNDPN
jgi:hypothetical protein